MRLVTEALWAARTGFENRPFGPFVDSGGVHASASMAEKPSMRLPYNRLFAWRAPNRLYATIADWLTWHSEENRQTRRVVLWQMDW